MLINLWVFLKKYNNLPVVTQVNKFVLELLTSLCLMFQCGKIAGVSNMVTARSRSWEPPEYCWE